MQASPAQLSRPRRRTRKCVNDTDKFETRLTEMDAQIPHVRSEMDAHGAILRRRVSVGNRQYIFYGVASEKSSTGVTVRHLEMMASRSRFTRLASGQIPRRRPKVLQVKFYGVASEKSTSSKMIRTIGQILLVAKAKLIWQAAAAIKFCRLLTEDVDSMLASATSPTIRLHCTLKESRTCN